MASFICESKEIETGSIKFKFNEDKSEYVENHTNKHAFENCDYWFIDLESNTTYYVMKS